MHTYRLQITVGGRERSLVIRADSHHLNDDAIHVFTDHLGETVGWVPADIVISITAI